MELTTLDILYIALTSFVSVVGVLLSIVLFKLIKILNVAVEISEYYFKIKSIFIAYSNIPQIIKEKVMSILKAEDKKTNKTNEKKSKKTTKK